jgi:hypothetical protein
MFLVLSTLIANTLFTASLMIAIAGRADFLREAAPIALFDYDGDQRRRQQRSMPEDLVPWIKCQQRYMG